jgi:hypothetical protein
MHREQLQFGHSDRLQVDVTEETKGQSFQKGENPSFQKVYTGCSIERSCTYIGCSIDRARTYTRCSTDRSCTCWFLLVQEGYRYRLITGYWYRLVTGCWHRLVQVYSGISHSDSVAVVSSSIWNLTSGRKDGARIGGCSHLPVVAKNIGGCSLLLVVARELGSWSFPQVVA